MEKINLPSSAIEDNNIVKLPGRGRQLRFAFMGTHGQADIIPFPSLTTNVAEQDCSPEGDEDLDIIKEIRHVLQPLVPKKPHLELVELDGGGAVDKDQFVKFMIAVQGGRKELKQLKWGNSV